MRRSLFASLHQLFLRRVRILVSAIRQVTPGSVNPSEQSERGVASPPRQDQLEDLVTDRTAQLAALVEQLEREIAERRQVEERLQHYAAELEQNNQELRTFTYIVSHDLRAPLINLKGFTAELRLALETIQTALDSAWPYLEESLRQSVTAALTEDVPEALGFIDSSINQMDNFINAILKLSRLGRRELYFEPLDMNIMVQETLQTLAHQIEQHQVQVHVGWLPFVLADRLSIQQILGNILHNAILYLAPARPGQIEISGEQGQAEVKYCIRDNGRGIAEADLPKVFEPFRRVGRPDVPGEGMGLAYVQTLVRRHGGQIWCQSEPGVGTTFCFTLPDRLRREEDKDDRESAGNHSLG